MRLLLLATILTSLYYISFRHLRDSSSPSFSVPSVWSKYGELHAMPSFDEPERPRPKRPSPPLTAKHRTRNGRPARVGSGATRERDPAGRRSKLEEGEDDERRSPDPTDQGEKNETYREEAVR